MDPNQGADMRGPHTTQYLSTGTTDGPQHPSVLEVNDLPGETDEARQPTQGTDTGH
jgi:hypothetical protein